MTQSEIDILITNSELNWTENGIEGTENCIQFTLHQGSGYIYHFHWSQISITLNQQFITNWYWISKSEVKDFIMMLLTVPKIGWGMIFLGKKLPAFSKKV